LPPSLDEVDHVLRRLDALLRLLLEGMQHVDPILQANGVHRPIGISVMVLHQLQHASDRRAVLKFVDALLDSRGIDSVW
jgi:hypothetical protein